MVGYPQVTRKRLRAGNGETEQNKEKEAEEKEEDEETAVCHYYYNSVCFVNPQGELVLTYQKHFLYETDENWALEGPSFTCREIPGLGKVRSIDPPLLLDFPQWAFGKMLHLKGTFFSGRTQD